jgi:hypothetical protein
MRVGGQLHAPATLPPGKRHGTHCTGGWVGPRAGLDGCGKPRLTGIRSMDRPARSESLYRLSFPGPQLGWKEGKALGRDWTVGGSLQQKENGAFGVS